MLLSKILYAFSFALAQLYFRLPRYRPYRRYFHTPIEQLQYRLDSICSLRKFVQDSEFRWTCAAYLGLAGLETPSREEQRFVSCVLAAKKDLEDALDEEEMLEALLGLHEFHEEISQPRTTAPRP